MRHSILILTFLMITVGVYAQRRINPVETPASQTQAVNLNPKETTQAPDPSKMPNLIHFHDEKGNVVYVDTITGKEFIDSTAIKKESKLKYPLLDDVTIGLNVWDPIVRAFGGDHGLVDIWAELSLYNRIKPVIELGIGQARHIPADSSYTYKSNVAPYFKVGVNYNFLFNKAKENQIYAGVRYGITPFSFEVDDVKINNSYWSESLTTSVPKQSSVAGYGEILLGLKVQIHKQWSLGWAFKYRMLLHESKCEYGSPWYIPGFGTRNSSLAGAFNVMYTIPLGKKKAKSTTTQTIEGETSTDKK